ncbi:cell division protein [Natronomonas sp. CBA1123]|jgi:cell division GTPase FtsZ|uniref:tubulin/FtsZ family protein n=1 Tax=Natronomonas sp. CBA1123 TaxID=2668070 RepID=UPI0012EA7B4F|nr:tubulin/FtsZ family protein [Natronomonas sp. CBA1123]MUV85188.1 cell division protein [Natronomonas sp. CBA1123]
MKLALIGFGNAGSKITDKLLEFERETGRTLTSAALAVNSARVDLERLEYVPEENRVLIGQTDHRSKGHGAGGDPDLGAEIAEQDAHEIERALDRVPIYAIDAFLIVAGLGGGTGSGGAPVLAETLRETYNEPVYGLGVLPSTEEGGRPALNAARSLQSFADATENLILFDNDAWRQSGDTVEAGYESTNEELAKRVATLLSAGEIDGSQVSENAMDSSDIRRTLATGGLSVIGYAEADRRSADRTGLLDRLRGTAPADTDGADSATKISSLVQKSVQSRLTCPSTVSSAERSLIVVSGPSEVLSRKGVESGRRWLEGETDSNEVLAGDDPRRARDVISVAVLLSNVTDIQRVKELQQQAVDAKERITAAEQRRDQEIQDLITDDEDELDPV